MVKSVWKYTLSSLDEQTFEMPEGAEILSADLQAGKVCIWALVNPEAILTARHIRVAGTGHPIREYNKGLDFIGTVLMMGDSLVWHIFEILP